MTELFAGPSYCDHLSYVRHVEVIYKYTLLMQSLNDQEVWNTRTRTHARTHAHTHTHTSRHPETWPKRQQKVPSDVYSLILADRQQTIYHIYDKCSDTWTTYHICTKNMSTLLHCNLLRDKTVHYKKVSNIGRFNSFTATGDHNRLLQTA